MGWERPKNRWLSHVTSLTWELYLLWPSNNHKVLTFICQGTWPVMAMFTLSFERVVHSCFFIIQGNAAGTDHLRNRQVKRPAIYVLNNTARHSVPGFEADSPFESLFNSKIMQGESIYPTKQVMAFQRKKMSDVLTWPKFLAWQ